MGASVIVAAGGTSGVADQTPEGAVVLRLISLTVNGRLPQFWMPNVLTELVPVLTDPNATGVPVRQSRRPTDLPVAVRVNGVPVNARSEERRVGKECRSRWSP